MAIRRILKGSGQRAKPREPLPDDDHVNAGVSEEGVKTATDGDLGFVPVEERGGAVSLIEGDPGPVGAIALISLSMLKGEEPFEGEEPAAEKLDEALLADAAEKIQ
jgi:hypothetical protein